jgi:hypothetical protein
MNAQTSLEHLISSLRARLDHGDKHIPESEAIAYVKATTSDHGQPKGWQPITPQSLCTCGAPLYGLVRVHWCNNPTPAADLPGSNLADLDAAPCDECGAMIPDSATSGVNSSHFAECSLYEASVCGRCGSSLLDGDDREQERCRECLDSPPAQLTGVEPRPFGAVK